MLSNYLHVWYSRAVYSANINTNIKKNQFYILCKKVFSLTHQQKNKVFFIYQLSSSNRFQFCKFSLVFFVFSLCIKPLNRFHYRVFQQRFNIFETTSIMFDHSVRCNSSSTLWCVLNKPIKNYLFLLFTAV